MPRLLVATALLVLTTSPAFAGLEIANAELCYGEFGPAVKVADYHPSDTVHVRFTVKGAGADSEGKCDAEITWSVLDGAGKEQFLTRAPAKAQPSFGSDAFPASLWFHVPESAAPGDYTLKISYRDNLSGGTAAFEKKFRVKAAEFAIVSPGFFHDAAFTLPAPAGGAVGEALHFRLGAVGFDRSQGKIDTEMTAQVFDRDSRAMLPRPITVVVASEDERSVREANGCNFNGSLQLTRPGEFTLRVTVTDRIGKKAATFEAPLKVTAP